MKPNVVTRFPPSPTGLLHIGGVRTALFNYLFTAHNKGVMYLRFEDTDKERSKKEFEEDIIAGLKWLGIPYTVPESLRQSERLSIYQPYVAKLIANGNAYEAEESELTPGKKVVRFKNPNSSVTFHDAIRGEVTFDTTELGDFVIARSIDEPLYHLAVVIDDHDMGVTHIIRGEDHVSNTQRQILIQEALEFTRPEYAHIPLILAPDKTKLSKRHGALSINEYRAQGFLPEALLNYLALLGWNPGGERELFTLDELVGLFTLERIHKAGAVFDIEKLKWFNHEHIKKLSDEEFNKRLSAFTNKPVDQKLIPLLKGRSQTLKEAADALATGEFDFLHTEPALSAELLLRRAKTDAKTAKNHLQAVSLKLSAVSDEDFTAQKVKDAIFPYATEQGRAAVLWPMRTALSGKDKSPDPFTLSELLGKQKTLERIERAALEIIPNRP